MPIEDSYCQPRTKDHFAGKPGAIMLKLIFVAPQVRHRPLFPVSPYFLAMVAVFRSPVEGVGKRPISHMVVATNMPLTRSSTKVFPSRVRLVLFFLKGVERRRTMTVIKYNRSPLTIEWRLQICVSFWVSRSFLTLAHGWCRYWLRKSCPLCRGKDPLTTLHRPGIAIIDNVSPLYRSRRFVSRDSSRTAFKHAGVTRRLINFSRLSVIKNRSRWRLVWSRNCSSTLRQANRVLFTACHGPPDYAAVFFFCICTATKRKSESRLFYLWRNEWNHLHSHLHAYK